MPVLIEGKAAFTTDELKFLDFVGSSNFPWYAGMATKHFPCLTHNLLLRTDEQTEGKPWSPHYPAARMVFDRLCAENGVSVRAVYRMAFNLTFSDPSKHGDPHIDHPNFPHKHMLIYLNKFDNGATYLFDESGANVVDTIAPEMDKFVIFDGGWHAQGFCRPQQNRMVFVATFDGDVDNLQKVA